MSGDKKEMDIEIETEEYEKELKERRDEIFYNDIIGNYWAIINEPSNEKEKPEEKDEKIEEELKNLHKWLLSFKKFIFVEGKNHENYKYIFSNTSGKRGEISKKKLYEKIAKSTNTELIKQIIRLIPRSKEDIKDLSVWLPWETILKFPEIYNLCPAFYFENENGWDIKSKINFEFLHLENNKTDKICFNRFSEKTAEAIKKFISDCDFGLGNADYEKLEKIIKVRSAE